MFLYRLLAITALLPGSGPALAALDCATVAGVTHTAPTGVSVSLQAGQTLTISTPDAGTLAVSTEFTGTGGTDDSLCNPATSCDGFSHTAQRTGPYVVDAFTTAGDTFSLTCSGGVVTGGTAAAQGTGAFVAAGGSTRMIGGAINNTLGSSAPAAVTRDGLFLSSRDAGSGMIGWAALQGGWYDGDVDGTSRELTFGMDFEVGADTRLGLFLSAGRADLRVNGVDVDSEAISFGPYFKTRFGDRYTLTGYALWARPDYNVGSLSYQAERRAAGLNANADYTWGSANIRSFIGVSGFSEDHPAAGGLAARDISSVTGAIGTRATFQTGTALAPYVSVGADFTRFDDGLGSETSYTSPRLGTGFSYDTGRGNLSLDLDGGRVLEDTRDLRLRMKYNLNF
ncbi:autotransporter domain-containing protein [Antarctobacter jejuensis]|uniref:autotransporter domain-containing protein n=1 Tax=Antarctobacter jejuensis TaxID=1439938 RepID=UPI003FCF1E1D